MSIGAGIFLFVLGAVLAFAVNGNIGDGYINLDSIGYILMAAGAVVFILGLVFTLKKRKSVSTSRSAVDPVSGEAVTQHETVHGDPLL
jgi:hypothetical protein